jgi:hypothetical protein
VRVDAGCVSRLINGRTSAVADGTMRAWDHDCRRHAAPTRADTTLSRPDADVVVIEIESAFQQMALVLAVTAAVGGLALVLRQPLIVGFIAAGILVGPQALGVIESPAEIELLATIGISLLLFVVGLKLDVRLVRTLGPVAAGPRRGPGGV